MIAHEINQNECQIPDHLERQFNLSFQCVVFDAVRKVKIMPDVPSGCSFRSFSSSSVNMECLRSRSSNFKSTVLAGWEAVRKIRVRPRPPLPATYSQRGLAYMQASAEYVREVSTLLKAGATSLRNSTTNETTQGVACLL